MRESRAWAEPPATSSGICAGYGVDQIENSTGVYVVAIFRGETAISSRAKVCRATGPRDIAFRGRGEPVAIHCDSLVFHGAQVDHCGPSGSGTSRRSTSALPTKDSRWPRASRGAPICLILLYFIVVPCDYVVALPQVEEVSRRATRSYALGERRRAAREPRRSRLEA